MGAADESEGRFRVVLRLPAGEDVDAGGFDNEGAALARAEEIVMQLAQPPAGPSWPMFSRRYVRPDAVISVDVVSDEHPRWGGSRGRAVWASRGEREPQGDDGP